MFNFNFTAVILLQILLLTESLYAGDACYADGEYGICLQLSECQSLVNEIRRAGNPMPFYMRRKLQTLTCGFDLSEPMVCCVSSDTDAYDPDWGTYPVTKSPVNTERPSHNDDVINFVSSSEENNNEYGDPFNRGTLENKNGPPDIEGHPNLRLLPKQCGPIEGDRIWGGNRTALYEMPWMVLLSYDSNRGPKLSCGGTLINQWYVLTAAHCVTFLSDDLRLDGVILGEYDVRQDPDCETLDGIQSCAPNVMNVTVNSVIVHPGYTLQTLADDIALIRLSQPADFRRANMKPMCLPVTSQLQKQSLPGLNGVVAGWGVTEDGLQSPVLLSVELPIISPSDCKKAYNGSLEISQNQICAGGVKDKDSCGGDSGGPLMYPGSIGNTGVRYVQRGIVSFGAKRCGIAGFPGVYTNVAYYMDWILDNIRS